MKEKIVKLIYNSVDLLNAELPTEEHIVKSANTTLFGSDSQIDSLGLVNLIVSVEQNIEDEFDIPITLADERAMSQEKSPFRTVVSLANYIEILLDEKLND